MKLTLKWDGVTGDGKRAFIIAEENDGWKDLRIEVDTDDCDSEHAKEMAQEVIDRCNRANTAYWQPIEAAPKDGTFVLLWAPDLLHGMSPFAVGQYIDHEIEWWHVHDGKFGPHPMRGAAPTHWMPLPEPPKP